MTDGLAGVRVIDFGHYIAGPMAALLLADAGAHVVHVDRAGRPSTMGIADAFLNRGKRRLALDLKQPTDLAVARELIDGADVVIENFRPGVMDRLGLGADASFVSNPRLIYCSLPGFPSDDARAHTPGWEGILHAATAGYRPMEEHWDPTGRRHSSVDDRTATVFTPITTASNFGALLGSTLIVAALLVRQRSGRGQRIQLPLVEAMVEAYSTMLGTWVHDKVPDGIMLRDMTYRCADGGMVDMSSFPKFVIRLLQAAGVAAEWERRGLINIEAGTFRADERDRIEHEFTALIGSRTSTEWDDVGMHLLAPLARVRTQAQWLATPHAHESGAVMELDDPVYGRVVMPGAAFDLENGRADTEALAPVSRSVESVATITQPLEGVRVIDITQAVAGPTAARLLADLGADVVKIGSPTPAVTDGIVAHLHRGKRTILLDTRAPEGREILDRLVRTSDALVTNFTPGAAESHGVGHERVRALNPNLVYCAVTAYGSSGPWAARRAYENQCNAATGMSWFYGEPFGWPLYQPSPINDAATGVLGALSTIVALYARTRGGAGQKVGTSLAQASTWHQAIALVRRAGSDGPHDPRSAYGRTALYRLYRASDRSFFLAARRDDLPRLAKEIGLEVEPALLATWNDAGGELARVLAECFRTDIAERWVTRLRAHDVHSQSVLTIEEAAAYLAGRGVVYFEPGVGGDSVARPGVGGWLSQTPPKAGANPGPVGSQAVEILHELGVIDDQITALAEAGVVRLPGNLPTVQLRT